jgi:hypothetical protein
MYQKKDSLEIFEFPLLENKATITVPQDKSITDSDTKKILDATLLRMAIIKTSTNEIIVRKLYYVPEYKYLLAKGYDISDVMLNKTNDDFTGLLITKNWNDALLSYHKVKNGKIEEILVKYDANKAKNNSLNSIKMNNYATAKASGLGDEQNLDEVVINNNYHAPTTYIYIPSSQPYFPTTSPSYNPYGTGGGGSGSTSTGNQQSDYNAQKIEENINDDKLDPCTKNVVEKLKNLSNVGDIAAMLKRFSAAGSIFNINMTLGKMEKSRDLAETRKTPGSSTDINIVLNEDYIKGVAYPNPPTDLSVAHTIVHEIIHAYLTSLLTQHIACGSSDICDFPVVYDAYVQQQITKYQTPVDPQHVETSEKYINAIACTLQEFNTGQTVTSGFPSQAYIDLAWGGLTDTYVFNKTFPNDSSHKNYADRQRIINRTNSEKLGNVAGQSSPLGTPCKK